MCLAPSHLLFNTLFLYKPGYRAWSWLLKWEWQKVLYPQTWAICLLIPPWLLHFMGSSKFSWVPREPLKYVLLRWLSYHYLFNRIQLTVTESKMALRTAIMDGRVPEGLKSSEEWRLILIILHCVISQHFQSRMIPPVTQGLTLRSIEEKITTYGNNLIESTWHGTDVIVM